jgi:hypothetical protein
MPPLAALGLLPLIGIGASAIGAGFSIYQGIQGRKAAGEAQEQAELNAGAAKKKAQFEEEQARLRLRRLIGSQRALYAKAGVDLSSGSPLLTLTQTEEEGQRELEMIRMGGNVDIRKQMSQARIYGQQGRTALLGGVMQGTSTFLSGLGKAGGMLGSAPTSSGVFGFEEGY